MCMETLLERLVVQWGYMEVFGCASGTSMLGKPTKFGAQVNAIRTHTVYILVSFSVSAFWYLQGCTFSKKRVRQVKASY